MPLSTPPAARAGARRPSGVRTLAAAAVASLLAAALLPVAAAAAAPPAAPDDGLIADYRFDQTSGTTVDNRVAGAPVGAATVINPVDGQWTGDALEFSGGPKNSAANWVRLPDGILGGKDAATITTEVQIDASMKGQNNFLWNIGNDATDAYFFTSVRDAPRTAITTSTWWGEVNARAATPLTAGQWYSLTTVIDGAADSLSFYIDGTLVQTTTTALSPASLTDQSLNAIGRSPWPDPFFKGAVSQFRVYDRALDAADVAAVSDADAALHADAHAARAQQIVQQLAASIDVTDEVTTLPAGDGALSWSTTAEGATITDGRTLRVTQPAAGEAARIIDLTATATVRGISETRTVQARIAPTPAATDSYGYLMVHFIEDADGYAEKIYLDVSRGDDPEQWDPLNGGQPILASALGTTGVRDPYITRNPDTGRYYIIATDLRVFGGDRGVNGCTEWCYWSSQGSTKLVVWESDDLVTWSAPHQLDVAPPSPRLGMAWAPEATWVPNFDGAGHGSFVVYWSSKIFADGATQPGYSRILWGSTTDFTAQTYTYGGVFVDDGGETIDTTLLQYDGTTYRITKDNAQGKGIYMDAATSPTWWRADTVWTRVQEGIGASWAGGNPGGVEGPAGFRRTGADTWYLYVDVIPTVGYKPMVTDDLGSGFTPLQDADFSMPPHTKHGGIVPISRGEYDRLRAADAVAAVTPDLGEVSIAQDGQVGSALPATATVTTAYGRGESALPVDWNTAGVDAATPGVYPVTGIVRSIGANDNDWVGRDGSTAWNAADRTPRSTTAITVTATVRVTAGPTPTATPTATPTPTPTATPTPTPTASPTASPSASPVPTGSASPTATPSVAVSASTVERGGSMRVSVSGLRAGEQISAELHSDPIRIGGIAAADASGRTAFEVQVPSSLPVGAHTVFVWDGAGTLIAQIPVTVVPAGQLAVTGAQTPSALALFAALLLLAGVGLRTLRRRVTD